MIRRLWSEDKVDFEGVHYHLSGAQCLPKPVQPDLPMWIGGSSEAAIKRTAKYGTGWQAGPETPEQAKTVVAAIREAAAAEGRAIDDDHYGAGIPFRFGKADEPGLQPLFDAYKKRTGRDPLDYFAIGDAEAIVDKIADLRRRRRLEIHPAPRRQGRRRHHGADPPPDRRGAAAGRRKMAETTKRRRRNSRADFRAIERSAVSIAENPRIYGTNREQSGWHKRQPPFFRRCRRCHAPSSQNRRWTNLAGAVWIELSRAERSGRMQADVVVLGAGMVGARSPCICRNAAGRSCWSIGADRARRPPTAMAGWCSARRCFPIRFRAISPSCGASRRNRSVDAYYRLSGPAGISRGRCSTIGAIRSRGAMPRSPRSGVTLIATCLTEHKALAEEAGSTELLRPIGFLRAFNDAPTMDRELAKAERARAFGVNSVALTAPELAQMEPHLSTDFVGALHWTDPYSVSDPHALTMSYVALFERLGGHFALGDAETLRRHGAGWRVTAADGSLVEAAEAVIALGIWSDRLTRRFGYAPPLFGKRGYHLHFKPQGNAGLTRPVASNGFLLAPMRAGIRLTTGAEFARRAAPPTPVQLARAEPIARSIFPLGEAVEPAPWMGTRPCTPDMMPIIGPAPSEPGCGAPSAMPTRASPSARPPGGCSPK